MTSRTQELQSSHFPLSDLKLCQQPITNLKCKKRIWIQATNFFGIKTKFCKNIHSSHVVLSKEHGQPPLPNRLDRSCCCWCQLFEQSLFGSCWSWRKCPIHRRVLPKSRFDQNAPLPPSETVEHVGWGFARCRTHALNNEQCGSAFGQGGRKRTAAATNCYPSKK